jgi:hypothetical protein
MKNILQLTMAVALAAAFTSTASAFPYAQPHFSRPETQNLATYALFAHGQSVDQTAKPAPSKKHQKAASAAQGN